jgi:hypothetical protein
VKCTGSIWGIDALTETVVARLWSPYLSKIYGNYYGIQGQVYIYMIYDIFQYID